MNSLQRRHFRKIATTLHEQLNTANDFRRQPDFHDVVAALATLFEDNDFFHRGRFIRAVFDGTEYYGKPEVPNS